MNKLIEQLPVVRDKIILYKCPNGCGETFKDDCNLQVRIGGHYCKKVDFLEKVELTILFRQLSFRLAINSRLNFSQ